MKKWTARTVALLIGMVLASVFVAVAVALTVPPDLWRRAAIAYLPHVATLYIGHPRDLPLSPPPQPVGCLELSHTLHVVTGVTKDLFEPMTEKRISRDRRTIRVEFSGHWAERRVALFLLDERAVTVAAFFDTDTGLYLGPVVAEGSSAHLHGDRLCFDLSVRRMDGSSRIERWRGQVLL